VAGGQPARALVGKKEEGDVASNCFGRRRPAALGAAPRAALCAGTGPGPGPGPGGLPPPEEEGDQGGQEGHHQAQAHRAQKARLEQAGPRGLAPQQAREAWRLNPRHAEKCASETA